MSIRSLILALAVAAVPALAQETLPLPGEHPRTAIVGGRHIQPRPEDGRGQPDPGARRLLEREKSGEPAPAPHDLYGQPLGGNPGLSPPGLPKQP
jgi:hypothetical protein